MVVVGGDDDGVLVTRETRAKAFREDSDSIENSFGSLPEILARHRPRRRGRHRRDWSAPVERKFFLNDRAKVVTVNLDQPETNPRVHRVIVVVSFPRPLLCLPFLSCFPLSSLAHPDPSPRAHRVTQKNNGQTARKSIIFVEESAKLAVDRPEL